MSPARSPHALVVHKYIKPPREFFLIRKHEGYPRHARARRRDHRIDAITASMLGASVCSLRSSRAMTSTVSLAEYSDVVNRVSHALQSSSPRGRMVHGVDVESHASTSGPTRSASARTHALRSRTGLPFSQCSATHAHPLSSTYASPRGFAHVDIRPRWGQETSLPPSRAVRERVAETLKLTIERGAVGHASGARGRRRVR